MRPKIDRPSIDTLTPAAIESLRPMMEFFGDDIGVDLRGASPDIVREFYRRWFALIAEEKGGRTWAEWIQSEETADILAETASQVAHELFGGAERAS